MLYLILIWFLWYESCLKNNKNIIFCQSATRFQSSLRLRGPYFDPFVDYSDLYYGVTHYGWTPPQEISLEQQQTLLDLKIAIVL